MNNKAKTKFLLKKMWPHGLKVRTSPFHGGNMGSNPVGVTKHKTILVLNQFILKGSIAQLGEHLPYKQGVTGSSPVVPTIQSHLDMLFKWLFLCRFF